MWRGSIPSTLISTVGTPPSSVTVTVTSAGSGCADSNSRSSCRCSLTSLPTGKADCRRIASRFSRCSVLTEDLPSVGLVWQRSRLARPGQSAGAADSSRPSSAGGSGSRDLAVAPVPELVDESRMGRVPIELGASPGRVYALIEQENLSEVVAEACSSLVVRSADRSRCAGGGGGGLGQFGHGGVQSIADDVVAPRCVVLQHEPEERRPVGDVHRGPVLLSGAQH